MDLSRRVTGYAESDRVLKEILVGAEGHSEVLSNANTCFTAVTCAGQIAFLQGARLLTVMLPSSTYKESSVEKKGNGLYHLATRSGWSVGPKA